MSKNSIVSVLVELKELAELFGVDDRTVQLWVTRGMPKKEYNKYDYVECSRWLIKKLRHQATVARDSGDSTLHGYKMEKQKMDMHMTELRYKKMMHEVIDTDMVKQVWLNEVKLFSRSMKNLSVKILNAVEGLTDSRLIKTAIDKEISAVMDGVAKELKIEFEESEANEEPNE